HAVVKNNGRETEEVLQVYIKAEDDSFGIINPALCGFGRERFAEKETRIVNIEIDKRAFTSVDEDGVRAIRGKEFTVYAGFSQPDSRSEALTGKKCLAEFVTL
ncbi:MAG: fibronectin type III-like domain-contianing protein, partial [Lachnospiraceae bacterium]|nr:fibronectin type III-like domain-contianing protein [Lachnospiraceae bacterium]